MQTCAKCNASSPDDAQECVTCGVHLPDNSTTTIALKNFQSNPRVKSVRISIAHDACPGCIGLLQTYPKDSVPTLPHHGCSHENGCRCFYEPVLQATALVGKIIK